MSIYLKRIILIILCFIGNYSYGQYSISGYLDTPEKNKKVYLCLLQFDEVNALNPDQILTSTLTDSLGYFSFEGSLLSDKHALYRIYANLNEDVKGVQKYDLEDLKNYHNFIFSNTDTIVFRKNKKLWFSSYNNTNPIDKEWKNYDAYVQKLQSEFLDLNNEQIVKQTTDQLLRELKSFVLEKKPHPLTTLLLLASLPQIAIKKDLSEKPEFYIQLLSELNAYYESASYALQYKSFLDQLYRSEIRDDVNFYKSLSYALGFLLLICLGGMVLLAIKLKHARTNQAIPMDFSLTTQEEKVAELMMDNKSNKEIASELFISLNTVKTHIRNLYAKLEVNTRNEFVEKFKNHPRD